MFDLDRLVRASLRHIHTPTSFFTTIERARTQPYRLRCRTHVKCSCTLFRDERSMIPAHVAHAPTPERISTG